MTPPQCTVGVVVTHDPDIATLKTSLQALRPQIDALILVDNGSGPHRVTALETLFSQTPEIAPEQTLFQPENLGLGQAQNAGIAAARALGADSILLMDQDSRPGPTMVQVQKTALARLCAAGERPAAIGAHYIEPERATRQPLPPGDAAAPEMQSVIASGSLIPLDALDQIGPFNEGLFVDFVDIEWCFRARAAGYRCFAARGAQMQHHIGETPLRILGRNMAVHTPSRNYYQMRNILLLARSPEMPRIWVAKTTAYFLMRSLVLTLFTPHRPQRARMIALGLYHGCLGQNGKRPDPTGSS